MAINIVPISTSSKAAIGIEASWEDGQYVMIITDKGIVSCGIIDKEVVEKVGYATALAYGTPEKQLITVDDLLNAKIKEVSSKAKEYGVVAGMTGKEALELLSK